MTRVRSSVRGSTGRRVRFGAILLALAALLLITPASAEQVPVDFGSSMLYLANSTDPALGESWVAPGYDDSSWAVGQYGVGYETSTGAENLLLTVVPAANRSVYTRVIFNVADAGQVQNLVLGVDYDDGFVAWLNGVEIFRSLSMPSGGALDWNTVPDAQHESSNGATPVYEYQDVSLAGLPQLQNGVNTLAIGVWNIGVGSSDLVLAPQLITDGSAAIDRGPYLQQGSDQSLVVRWRTTVPTDSVVMCGDQPTNLTVCAQTAGATTEHEVEVTGLTADTQYYYSVGSSTVTLAGGDPDHFFLTSPAPGSSRPSRIWILGDSGTGTAAQAAVRDAYYSYTGATHTDLWLMLGDNAYPAGTDADYQAKLFDVYPSMLAKSVLWPTAGNHDLQGMSDWPYFDMFSLPTAGEAGGLASGLELFYSFDYGNVHFVSLDSQNVNRTPTGAMLTWLDLDLAATTADWIIAFWHHPPYSKGSHDSDTEGAMLQMRQNALPILEDNGVDLTFTGHSHSYERSVLIDGHYGDSTTFGPGFVVDGGDGAIGGDGAYAKPFVGPDPHSGAVHTVAGSSGKITGGPLNHPAMEISLNMLGSVVLDIDGPRLDATFLDSTGAVLDQWTLVKGGSGLPPVADFQATPQSGSMPLTVDFSDLSQNGPEQWAWDFEDDGNTDSAVSSPSHQYDQPGRYSVRLDVTNLVGADTMTRVDEICVHEGTPPPADGVSYGIFDDTFYWNAGPGSAAYDVVRGDLGQLLSSAGDFAASSAQCLENDGIDSLAQDASLPAPGQGFFYLVRRVDCTDQVGSYDSTGPGQVGLRDTALQGAGTPCE